MMCILKEIFLLCFLYYGAYAIQCMDEVNSPVDWYIIYKLPAKDNSEDNRIKEGVAYFYLSSKPNALWTYSRLSISNSKSTLGNTLVPFYSNQDHYSYVFYNNDPPNDDKNYTTAGYTKGAVITNNDGGFWLLTSSSQFPAVDKFTYPNTAKTNAEMFFCLSMDLDNIDKIGTIIQNNEAHIFKSYIQESMISYLPKLSNAIKTTKSLDFPYYQVDSITSLAGMEFITFTKSRDFDADLYDALIAPILETNLSVQSYSLGSNEDSLESNCTTKYQVIQIQEAILNNETIYYYMDNSKWAVSPTFQWVCIGDIDRCTSQKSRGGGAICVNDKHLTELFLSLILTEAKCVTSKKRVF